MKFKTLATTLILLSSFTFASYAQRNHAKEAWTFYLDAKYYDAKEKFKFAAEKEKKLIKKAELYFMVGECYREIVIPDQAEFFYKKALDGGFDKNGEVYWKLGEVQRMQATDKGKDKYREAEESFRKYYEKTGNQRGKDMADACKKSQEWMSDPTRHIINNETVLNTENMDFSPVFLDRKNEVMIFTSSRPAGSGEGKDPHTGDFFTDLYETKRDKKGKFDQPVPMKVVNTEYNEGASVLDSRKSTLYYTRCPFEKNKKLGCDICMTEKKGNNWGEPVVLKLRPAGEEADSITLGHPALTPDNKILVFASDMPGGQGGRDLWMSKWDNRNKEWGTPENLGPQINTPGNEMFPYIPESGELYFSSDGHPGMGGLDIFMAKKISDEKWGEIENLKYPMNSPQDDFGIIFDGGPDRGYFSSNRVFAGAKGRDDIYNFVLPPLLFTLTVEVVNLVDGNPPIPDASIALVGSDGSNYLLKSDENGKQYFEIINDKRYINENTTYTIEVKHPKFVAKGKTEKEIKSSAMANVSTQGLRESTDFYKKFYLQAIDKPFHMPMIMYEFDKADLMVDPTGTMKGNDTKAPLNSKDSLNYLYDLMVDNPTWIVLLRSHTDQRGSDKYNLKLSQRRAQACVDYLVKEKGIPADRLVAKGMGETEPINLEADIKKEKVKDVQENLYMQNRRTDFKILSTDYVPKEAPKPE